MSRASNCPGYGTVEQQHLRVAADVGLGLSKDRDVASPMLLLINGTVGSDWAEEGSRQGRRSGSTSLLIDESGWWFEDYGSRMMT